MPRMLRQMADEVDVFLMSAKEQQQMAKLQMIEQSKVEQMGKQQIVEQQMAEQRMAEERQIIEKPGLKTFLSLDESRHREIPESGEDLKSFEGEGEGLAAEAMIAVERLDYLEEVDPVIAAEEMNLCMAKVGRESLRSSYGRPKLTLISREKKSA